MVARISRAHLWLRNPAGCLRRGFSLALAVRGTGAEGVARPTAGNLVPSPIPNGLIIRRRNVRGLGLHRRVCRLLRFSPLMEFFSSDCSAAARYQFSNSIAERKTKQKRDS
jgi:hypothetical protein